MVSLQNTEGREWPDITGFTHELGSVLAEMGAPPLTAEQTGLLAGHYRMMIEWNQRANLTRITDAAEAARKHYAESIFGAQFIPAGSAVLDIGSGAGFPAVPVAIVRPDLSVTALEPHLKKSVFLDEVKDALALENLRVARERVEGLDLSQFDVLTSRALDRAEQVIPAVIGRMHAAQSMVLFCTANLVDIVEAQFGAAVSTESHPIPGTDARLVCKIEKR